MIISFVASQFLNQSKIPGSKSTTNRSRQINPSCTQEGGSLLSRGESHERKEPGQGYTTDSRTRLRISLILNEPTRAWHRICRMNSTNPLPPIELKTETFGRVMDVGYEIPGIILGGPRSTVIAHSHVRSITPATVKRAESTETFCFDPCPPDNWNTPSFCGCTVVLSG